jgi:GNAT superfamily N-acetyltransferase
MAKEEKIELIDVNKGNVSETGFFCLMSRRKSEGFQEKLKWAKERFDEGMRIKMLGGGARAFIEYIPGEYAWRGVNAKGYLFIHCLWVVGKSKGKGYGGFLIDECIKDAKKSGMRGVAMITTEGNWLAGKKLLVRHGFEPVAKAPPSFELMVKKFKKAPSPSFINDWDKKASRYKKGLVILCTAQCPYLLDATNILLDAAGELGIKSGVIELRSAQEVRDKSPSPYGVFGVVYNGKLLSYHYLLKKDFLKHINEL